MIGGIRGDITDDWSYDVSYSYGKSDRTQVDAGYTNVAEHRQRDQCRQHDATCRGGQPGCVPIDVFGGFGTITPAMALYAGATALEQQLYDQLVINGVVTGALYQLPWVDTPIAASFGADYRSESGETKPDLCLQTAPGSCLGGAGGYTLPTKGQYNVQEYYGELIVPLPPTCRSCSPSTSSSATAGPITAAPARIRPTSTASTGVRSTRCWFARCQPSQPCAERVRAVRSPGPQPPEREPRPVLEWLSAVAPRTPELRGAVRLHGHAAVSGVAG